MEKKNDQELLAEAYGQVIKEAGDMDSHLGIATGGYQQEARPEAIKKPDEPNKLVGIWTEPLRASIAMAMSKGVAKHLLPDMDKMIKFIQDSKEQIIERTGRLNK